MNSNSENPGVGRKFQESVADSRELFWYEVYPRKVYTNW